MCAQGAGVSLLSAVEPVQAVLMRPHSLLEAPRFGADGALVYSDVIAGGLWACTRAGEVRELLASGAGSAVCSRTRRAAGW